jgi:hypothetical protein
MLIAFSEPLDLEIHKRNLQIRCWKLLYPFIMFFLAPIFVHLIVSHNLQLSKLILLQVLEL